MSYRVWSALIITHWESRTQVSCRSCGRKAQLGDALFSLVLGWWGFPWGLIFTPVQIARNIGAALSHSSDAGPSPKLENAVRVMLGSQAVSRTAATPKA